MLAEPGIPYKRGAGKTAGHIMAALGDRPAAKITTREINDVLASVSATGASPRTINKYREVIAAAFSYGCKPSTNKLPENPASSAAKRRKPEIAALVFYRPEEVEAIARALEGDLHRDPTRPAISGQEKQVRALEDRQDAELVRVAAYAGLRMGELLALRWSDVDFAGSALTIGVRSAQACSPPPSRGRCAASRSPTREPQRSIASAAASTTRVATTSSFATRSATRSTTRRFADATSEPRRQRASRRCASTICATPSARCSPRTASTS